MGGSGGMLATARLPTNQRHYSLEELIIFAMSILVIFIVKQSKSLDMQNINNASITYILTVNVTTSGLRRKLLRKRLKLLNGKR